MLRVVDDVIEVAESLVDSNVDLLLVEELQVGEVEAVRQRGEVGEDVLPPLPQRQRA